MKVAEIWRYPVKSMAGEMLERAYVDYTGIDGDRVAHVENSRGLLMTARQHPRLLGHRAKLDEEGEPLVDGAPWSEASAQNKVVSPGLGARGKGNFSTTSFARARMTLVIKSCEPTGWQ